MNFRVPLLFALLAGCVCCGRSGAWLEHVPAREIDYEREVKWLDIPPDTLGCPEMMAAFGPWLLWADNNDALPLRVFDLRSGESHAPLRKGRAGSEVLNIHQIVHDPYEEEGFAVVDNFNRRTTSFVLGAEGCRRVGDRATEEFSALVPLGDTIVGTRCDGRGRYTTVAAGTEPFIYGDYSAYGLSDEAGWGLMQGHLCADPRSGRLAWFGYYTAVYEIVDYRCGETLCSEVLDMSAFNRHGEVFTTLRPDSAVGFISLAAGDEGIWALYDGKPLSHYMQRRGIGTRGNDLCLFDWDGSCRGRLHSRLPVRCLAWNERQRRLFLCVVGDDGEYRIGTMEPVLSGR